MFIQSTFSRERMQPKNTLSLSKFDQFCSMFKRYLGMPTPRRTDGDKIEGDINVDKKVKKDQGNSSENQNVPLKESDTNEQNSTTKDEMEASCSQELKSESITTTEHLKSSCVKSEVIVEDTGVFVA